jgi:hypothetical protein
MHVVRLLLGRKHDDSIISIELGFECGVSGIAHELAWRLGRTLWDEF